MRVGLAASLLFLAGCSTAPHVDPVSPPLSAPEVTEISLGGLYNVVLIRGTRAILVDTGPEESWSDLVEGLDGRGLSPRDLSLVVLTHAHSDHAGNAQALQKLGIPILVGEGDAEMLRAGDHGELHAANLEAVVAQPFIPSEYPSVEPDVVVGAAPYDLRRWGLEGEVIHVGAHTPGSLVVHLHNGAVVLGDLVRSGWLMGYVGASAPTHHLYQAFPVAESQRAAEDFVRGVAACDDVRVAFVGHGEPIGREALRSWAASEAPRRCPW